jgi:hypothetical protein
VGGLPLALSLASSDSSHFWRRSVRMRASNIDFYEELNSETRALVPLKRFYWPVANVAV